MTGEGAAHKTVLLNAADRGAVRPERVSRASGSPSRPGPVEPRPRRHRPGAHPVRPAHRGGAGRPAPVRHRPDRGRDGRSAAACRSTRVGGRLVTTVFDLLMAQYAVRRDGLPGEWPAGYDDAGTPGTPAWQEPITSRAGRRGGPGGPGVRPQRRAVAGPVDDRHGRGHQPLVPLRPDLPDVLHPDHAVRLPGRERRRLGALRRAGEGPPVHRLVSSWRSRWTGSGRPGT